MALDPGDFYEKHAEEYDEEHTLDELADEFRHVLEAFETALDGNAVLDAGCGPGRDTEYFHSNGLDPVGIDLSAAMVERASRTRPGTYGQMDIRELAFDTDTFDGVWCPAAIYFVPPAEMEVALREFRRVLTPGGLLDVAFKLGDGATTKDRWGDTVTEYHLDEATATRYVESNGFTILDEQTEPRPDFTYKNILCRTEPSGAVE